MFGKKDHAPQRIPLSELSDRDLTRIAELTSGQPFLHPDPKDGQNTVLGISYPKHQTLIFDAKSHVLEVEEGGGTRIYDISSKDATIHQDKKQKEMVISVTTHLGTSDTHETRIMPVKITISPQGAIHQETIFPTE